MSAKWGVVIDDDDLGYVPAGSRREALLRAGFCTPWRREKIGPQLYEYTTNESAVLVGSVKELQRLGYEEAR